MGADVVNLCFLAASLFSNHAIYASGFQVDTTLQGNHFTLKDVSHKVMERAVANPRSDSEIVQEYLDRKVVEEKIRRSWDQLMSNPPGAVTEIDRPEGKLVTFGNTGALSLKQVFQFMQFYPLLYGGESKPTEFHVSVGTETQKFKLRNKPDGTFTLNAVRSGGEVDLSSLQNSVNLLSDQNLKGPLRDTRQDVTLRALNAKLNSQPDFSTALQSHDTKGTVSTKERDDAFLAAIDVMAGTSILSSS